MKSITLSLMFIFTLFVFSCGSENHYYYKSFFIAETTFDIEGEVFVNDELTEKAVFDKIAVKVDSINNWEIEGFNETENKFKVTVDTTANGITLPLNTGIQDNEFLFYGFPEDFIYYTLSFYIGVRRAKGAIEPEFNELYYYIYVPNAVNISKTEFYEGSDKFGTVYSYYHYDLNFSRPGWYKVYYSWDKPIGNRPAYSSGGNTKIRAPR